MSIQQRMHNTLYFLRHAMPFVDENKRVSEWQLSEAGLKETRALVESRIFDEIDVIITSSQDKTYQTALPIAQRLKKTIIQMPELDELKRNNNRFLEEPTFSELNKRLFAEPDHAEDGWESANSALKRFAGAIESITRQYTGKKVLIVSHGTMMSLYFAYLKKDDAYARWKRRTMLCMGIVQNGKVIKDF